MNCNQITNSNLLATLTFLGNPTTFYAMSLKSTLLAKEF